jgi:adenylosuccinate synthase
MQWGDEGKGKIVDLLSDDADLAVRCQGGANAGHTVEVGEARFILRLVPSGILHAHTRCLIGNGVVIDPAALFRELGELLKLGIQWEGRLFVAGSAHIVMPYHKLEEQAEEYARGDKKIGTTLRGIGPAYADKVARRGVRISDLYDHSRLRELVCRGLEHRRAKIETLPDVKVPSGDELVRELEEYAVQLKPLVVNGPETMHAALERNDSILYECAQGSLLDIDFGTYPYVTSSSTSIGGVLTGLGIGPKAIDQVVGVTKAYCTRVGNGPFPTELNGALGERLRERGREFGSVTGRPRRCGWLDGVLLRYTARINGVTHLAVTKLDVLDGVDPIRVCKTYKNANGTFDASRLENAEPVYEEWPGWKESTCGVTEYGALPANTKRYLDRLAELAEAKLKLISTGPNRAATIKL